LFFVVVVVLLLLLSDFHRGCGLLAFLPETFTRERRRRRRFYLGGGEGFAHKRR
jgi:hypothetical protein